MGYLDCNGDGQTDTAAGVTPEIQQDLVEQGEKAGQAALMVTGFVPLYGGAIDAYDIGAAIATGNYWSAAGQAALMALPGSTRAYKEGAGAVGRAIRCFNSFEAGTLVSTPNGLVPIEQILIGDYVLAYNEATGEIDAYPVTDLISHIDMEVVYLRIDGEMIVTTDEHPFYTSDGEWVDAGDLAIGDEIRQLDWETGTVEAVYTVTQPQQMYNFTVGTAHTYFVGDEQWLVHNSGPCDELALGLSKRRNIFKTEVPNTVNYEDLGLDPANMDNLVKGLEDAMNNAKVIHFDVTGLSYLNTPNGVLKGNPNWNAPGSTNWELRTIWDDPELLGKTRFYLNGKEISIEQLQEMH